LLVSATVVASVLLDHFSALGFEVHPAETWRVVGAASMVAGVALVARSKRPGWTASVANT
jgi:transporter family-2 protein